MTATVRFVLPLTLLAALAACSRDAAPPPAAETAPAPATEAATPAPDRIAEALAGDHRSDENRARDVWRHPHETLSFFSFRPDAVVVEITPGGGWYTEVLAPALRETGTLIAAVVDPASAGSERAQAYYTRSNDEYRAKLAEQPKVYGEVQVREFALSEPSFGDEGSADLVLTFRNVHNWIGSGAAPGMFAGFYQVLKPGGVLGVVEHRAQPGSPAAENTNSGYMTEEAVIALATEAGFELAGKSEVNANPADPTDHANGVWTLPPALRVPEGEDPEKYRAIGESDRMTLRFVKPQEDRIKRTSMD